MMKRPAEFGKYAAPLVIVGVIVLEAGGAALFSAIGVRFGARTAEAVYTGKHIRTVEYLLGGGTDATTRGDDVQAYAGSSWNTAKASAGVKNVVIEGSGIRVLAAYLDVSFMKITGAADDTLDIGVTIDVEGSSSQGTDANVDEEKGTLVTDAGTGDLTHYVRSTHDVTAFFDRQTDAMWNAGVGVVASVRVDFTASSRSLTQTKLVLTYEQDYSSTAHTETKTVRFPLDSTAGSDTGSRTTTCIGGATCSFAYFANIPDAVADGDILDVFFEVQGLADTNAALTWTLGIRGGSASSSAYDPVETNPDATNVHIAWAPSVGSPDFQRNTAQYLDILIGAGGGNITALGGELVVTYRFSTGATEQTETIRYFLHQRTSTPGTTKNSSGTTTVSIANAGFSTKHIWLKVRTAPTANHTFTIYGRVGTTTEKSNAYTVNVSNPRAGDTPAFIYDMSADAGNLFQSNTEIAAYTQFTTGGTPPGVELYVTFTWRGDQGGTQTKTAVFSATSQGIANAANSRANRPVRISLPETVVKTYRSVYIEAAITHTESATIAIGTMTVGANGSTTVISEVDDREGYHATYFHQIASTTFSNGDTIAWTSRTIEANFAHSSADEVYIGGAIIVTYDAALGGDDPSVNEGKRLRTIEYLLGGGSDNTNRTTGTLVYAGSAWNTTKGTAGVKNIVIEGSGIHVVAAYLDVGFIISSSANVTDVGVTLDVEGASSQGSDVYVDEVRTISPWNTSGLAGGYFHSTHDATALFDRQTDAQWNAGLDLVGSVTVAGPSWTLTTMKLIITYEENYTLVPHTAVKTVRFPLDSTAGSDTGTRTTTCAAGATCSFAYFADIPDAVADADILDAFFEVSGYINSASASTIQVGIRGGTASSSVFNWVETSTNANTISIAWAPSVGSPNFVRNTGQFLDVLLGTVSMTALGGELVVTYRYSTGATAQTETIRYYMNQATGPTGTTKNTAGTTTVVIANGGLSTKHVWLRVETSPSASETFTVFGRVGTSTEKSNAYTITSGVRYGRSPTLYYDMSADAGNIFSGTTTIAAYTQSSVSTAPPGVEVLITFTWRGDLNGPETRTVLFPGSQEGVDPTANSWANRSVAITLPERVAKTYRSAYLESRVTHSDATSIIIGTITIGANASTTVITEVGDTESYTATYFSQIASTTFSNGDAINWNYRTIELNQTHNMAEEVFFGNVVVVTYDAAHQSKVPAFHQNYFRFYVDNNALTPSDPWPSGAVNLGENTEITAADTPLGNADRVRIRMSLQVATTSLVASSTQFKLQYAPRVTTCAAISTWSDLGAVASGAIWRGFNASTGDGTQLAGGDPPPGGTVLLSVTDRAGTYEEENPTAVNPFVVAVGEDVEYDWNIEQNGAATNTSYCFRMTKSDGTPLDRYDFYPTITTKGYMPESRNWRWYNDENNVDPSDPLANENVAPSNIETSGNTIKLRLTIAETYGENGPNQKFRLQFSTVSDFSSDVNFVVSTSSCTASAKWCYGDGVDTDNDAVTVLRLTDSTTGGTHNEGTTTSTFMAPASSAAEYEFTLVGSGANAATTYFFRAWDVNHNRPVPLGSGESYPSLSTEGGTLSFAISGISSGSLTEGVTTDTATTPTAVPFGAILADSGKVAAQRLTVTTNASEGYQIILSADQSFLSDEGVIIPDITGTNASPGAWASVCAASASGCWGYHAGDDTLAGGSTRFLADDTYARFATTTSEEVVYSAAPVTDETTDMVYRVYVRKTQPRGNYTVRLTYVIVPIF